AAGRPAHAAPVLRHRHRDVVTEAAERARVVLLRVLLSGYSSPNGDPDISTVMLRRSFVTARGVPPVMHLRFLPRLLCDGRVRPHALTGTSGDDADVLMWVRPLDASRWVRVGGREPERSHDECKRECFAHPKFPFQLVGKFGLWEELKRRTG